MHGSPLSKWDNRDLWKRYNYRDYGIIAEPYFDLDFDEVFYLTDTGRSWNNSKASVRDKVEGTEIGGRRSEVRDPQITQITRISRKGTEVSRLRTRRARALSRQEATSCQGGHGSEQIFLSDGLF